MNLFKLTYTLILLLTITFQLTDSSLLLTLLMKVMFLKGGVILTPPIAVGSFLLGQGIGFLSGGLSVIKSYTNGDGGKIRIKWRKNRPRPYNGHGGHGHGPSNSNYKPRRRPNPKIILNKIVSYWKNVLNKKIHIKSPVNFEYYKVPGGKYYSTFEQAYDADTGVRGLYGGSNSYSSSSSSSKFIGSASDKSTATDAYANTAFSELIPVKHYPGGPAPPSGLRPPAAAVMMTSPSKPMPSQKKAPLPSKNRTPTLKTTSSEETKGSKETPAMQSKQDGPMAFIADPPYGFPFSYHSNRDYDEDEYFHQDYYNAADVDDDYYGYGHSQSHSNGGFGKVPPFKLLPNQPHRHATGGPGPVTVKPPIVEAVTGTNDHSMLTNLFKLPTTMLNAIQQLPEKPSFQPIKTKMHTYMPDSESWQLPVKNGQPPPMPQGNKTPTKTVDQPISEPLDSESYKNTITINIHHEQPLTASIKLVRPDDNDPQTYIEKTPYEFKPSVGYDVSSYYNQLEKFRGSQGYRRPQYQSMYTAATGSAEGEELPPPTEILLDYIQNKLVEQSTTPAEKVHVQRLIKGLRVSYLQELEQSLAGSGEGGDGGDMDGHLFSKRTVDDLGGSVETPEAVEDTSNSTTDGSTTQQRPKRYSSTNSTESQQPSNLRTNVANLLQNSTIDGVSNSSTVEVDINFANELNTQLHFLKGELLQFFTLLSVLDEQDDCLKMMVCNIHAKESSQRITVYEQNILQTFRLLPLLLGDSRNTVAADDDPITTFRLSAKLGELSNSTEFCTSYYHKCTFSTEQIIGFSDIIKDGASSTTSKEDTNTEDSNSAEH